MGTTSRTEVSFGQNRKPRCLMNCDVHKRQSSCSYGLGGSIRLTGWQFDVVPSGRIHCIQQGNISPFSLAMSKLGTSSVDG
jgi:hypothetical protein